MIVYNPTDKTIGIQYKGIKYEIAAGKSEVVPDEAASYWKERIHEFIVLSDETSKVKASTPTAPTPPVKEEVKVEEPKETKVVETPKK